MENLYKLFQLAIENWRNVIIGGVILVCTIVMLVGLLKKVLISKIPNKLVKKFVTAFSGIILVFPVTALYFVGKQISFDYYWWSCLAVSVLTVLTYWLYENTLLRDAISVIGNNTIMKVFRIFWTALFNKDKNIKEELKDITDEVTTDTENIMKDSHSVDDDDDDLKNL